MDPNPRKLQDFLLELAANLQIAPAPLSESEHFVRWKISPSHDLQFGTLEQDFTVVCIIAEPPSRNREDFYMLLMSANFLGQGTGGNILGMDKEEKYLTLSSIIPYDVNARRFKEIVEDFVNFVDFWREELARHITQASGPFA